MPRAPLPTGPRPDARARPGRVLAEALALAALGVLTALLGTSTHLARDAVGGVLLPWGVVLAVALVVATDLAVAAATLLRRRPRPGWDLLSVAAGRGAALGVLLLPSEEGDVVLTGLPASTAWILLALLVPAFLAPVVTALAVGRTRPGTGAVTGTGSGSSRAVGDRSARVVRS